jgi:hypothetical protein
VVIDAYPAVERSSQQEVERRSEESLLLFERVQRGSDLEVAAGLEFEHGHQLAVAKSSASPISCPKVVPGFEAIIDFVFERAASELLNQLLDGASREDHGDLAAFLPKFCVGKIPFHQCQAQAVKTLAVCLQAIACGDAAERRKGFTTTLPQQR